MELEITQDKIGERIDVAISSLLPNFSRTMTQKLIKENKIYLDGVLVLDPSKKIITPGLVTIDDTPLTPDYEIIPEKIDLDIIFEDEFLIVLNKKAGLVCHPAPGHRSGTLVNAVAYHFKNSLSDLAGTTRLGIVHRLDKDTSGLMLLAKTNESHMALANLFANEKGRLISRRYTCFVYGIPNSKSGRIETLIARHPKNRQTYTVHETHGKLSVTLYNVEKSIYFTSTKGISKVSCELLTGRTHQIRVHMKYLGNCIIGDQVYGKHKIEPVYPDVVKSFSRQALHSSHLEFQHPFTHEWLSFDAELPDDMTNLDRLFAT